MTGYQNDTNRITLLNRITPLLLLVCLNKWQNIVIKVKEGKQERNLPQERKQF